MWSMPLEDIYAYSMQGGKICNGALKMTVNLEKTYE